MIWENSIRRFYLCHLSERMELRVFFTTRRWHIQAFLQIHFPFSWIWTTLAHKFSLSLEKLISWHSQYFLQVQLSSFCFQSISDRQRYILLKYFCYIFLFLFSFSELISKISLFTLWLNWLRILLLYYYVICIMGIIRSHYRETTKFWAKE